MASRIDKKNDEYLTLPEHNWTLMDMVIRSN